MGEVIRFPDRTEQAPRPAESPRPGAAPVERATPAVPEPLWREAAGAALREERQRCEWTLADVAQRAGVSVQYLSEVERGLKEPSSEVLAAVAGALGLRLADLTLRVSRRLAGPVCLAA